MAPIGTEDSFKGNDFSNNLFSDLAPILSLFGEQVTKQFLSVSLAWTDHVLLAMGPIGIMTIVVSAIRVGGSPWLKSLVGRSREERAVVEQELLSSTSSEVCEMWNGNSIIRTRGKAPNTMKTLIITGEGDIKSIMGAIKSSIYRGEYYYASIVEEFYALPPNLTLNLRSQSAKSWTPWWLAAFGVLLQFAALIVSGFATYTWGWTPLESGNPAPRFAYPLYCGGSLLVFAGVMACGYIIEGSTREQCFTCDPGRRDHVVRVQEPCSVGDQNFPGGLVFNPLKNPDIICSYRRENDGDWEFLSKLLTLLATIVTMGGFIAQFIGLRNLDWRISIIQLAVTLIMTLTRAWVRRGLSDSLPFAWANKVFEFRKLEDFFGWEEAVWPWFLFGILSIAKNPSQSVVTSHWEDFNVGLARIYVGSFFFPHTLDTTPTSQLSPSSLQKEGKQNWDRKIALLQHLVSIMDKSEVISAKVTQTARRIEVAAYAITKQVDHRAICWREHSKMGERGLELVWTLTVVDSAVMDGWALSQISIVLPTHLHDGKLGSVTNPTNLEGLLFYTYYGLAIGCIQTGESFVSRSPINIKASWQIPRNFVRIVGTKPPHEDCPSSHLGQWMNRSLSVVDCPSGKAETGRDNFGFDPNDLDPLKKINGPYFGMYLSSTSRDDLPVRQGPRTWNGIPPQFLDSELAIVDKQETTYLLQMARELFSLLILALAAEIKEVRGKTTRTDKRQWANTYFDALGNEAVKAGLATDLDDALTLVIPAFARYNLLPREYSRDDEDSQDGEGTGTSSSINQTGEQGEGSGVRRRGPTHQTSESDEGSSS